MAEKESAPPMKTHLRLPTRPRHRYVLSKDIRDDYVHAACGDLWKPNARTTKIASEVTCGACWNSRAMRRLAENGYGPERVFNTDAR